MERTLLFHQGATFSISPQSIGSGDLKSSQNLQLSLLMVFPFKRPFSTGRRKRSSEDETYIEPPPMAVHKILRAHYLEFISEPSPVIKPPVSEKVSNPFDKVMNDIEAKSKPKELLLQKSLVSQRQHRSKDTQPVPKYVERVRCCCKFLFFLICVLYGVGVYFVYFKSDDQLSLAVEEESTESPSLLSSDSPISFPTTFPSTHPTEKFTGIDVCSLAIAPNSKFCIDEVTLGFCEEITSEDGITTFVASEKIRDCSIEPERTICRCPDGLPFSATFGCAFPRNLNTFCFGTDSEVLDDYIEKNWKESIGN